MKMPSYRLAALSFAAFCTLYSPSGSRAGDAKEDLAKISPFGIGGDARTTGALEAWIPQMAELGIFDLRTGATIWRGVAPKAGESQNWEKLDAQLDLIDKNHMQCGALLLGSSKANPGKLPLNDLPGWSQYVTDLVKHSNGRLKHFEVWNEPPNFTGNATPEDYAKIVVASYDAAKAADPNALVGLAAKSVHINFLERAIKAGAKDHFDYITLHPYETLGCATRRGGVPIYMSIVSNVRKMLAADDPERVNVPIIFTELGASAKKSADTQAYAVVKAYAMGIAQGVTCINWFEGKDGDSGPMGLLEANGNKRPSYTAMGTMIKMLSAHPVYQGWVILNDKDYAFVFQAEDKRIVMCTWTNNEAVTDKVDFGQTVEITDPMTGKSSNASDYSLTTAPIFVTNLPAKMVSDAQANKDKPLWWGGDFTGAKSVSITLDGNKVVEKGLHSQAGDAVGADIIDYGGSARSGKGVSGGNVYMVDPNFLSFDHTPIEITVVCRRDKTNKPASMKLTYESTQGGMKPTPFAIPDKDGWSTASWQIKDAEFVSMYGFNFLFEPGAYFVQSVTVTKIDK